MENNNNNGRGIFYGVIGVATLVVAIIGATFAFFTATVNTDNEAINVSAATVRLELDADNTKTHFKNNLIPVDVLSNETATLGQADANFYKYPGDNASGVGSCMDDVKNSVCSLYQIAVKNPTGSPTQTVEGLIQVTLNEGFKNLHYAVFSGTIAQLETATFKLQDTNHKWTVTDASKTGSTGLITYGVIDSSAQESVDAAITDGAITAGAKLKTNGGWTKWGKASEVELAAGETATYTILLWLEDTGANQNDEMNAVFTAAVKFQSAAGSEVSGVISATGPTA